MQTQLRRTCYPVQLSFSISASTCAGMVRFFQRHMYAPCLIPECFGHLLGIPSPGTVSQIQLLAAPPPSERASDSGHSHALLRRSMGATREWNEGGRALNEPCADFPEQHSCCFFNPRCSFCPPRLVQSRRSDSDGAAHSYGIALCFVLRHVRTAVRR